MTGAYDVLARIRAAETAPQPAGERCEMCSETIADEHQHVVNVEGRQLMCVCRGCYLLFTDTNAPGCAIARCPTAIWPFRTSRSAGGDWQLLQIPVGSGVLLPQLGAGPDGRVLSGSGGRDRIRAGSGGLERYSRSRRTGGHARRRHRSRPDRAGARRRTATAAMPSGAHRRLLRVRRHDSGCSGTASTAASRCASSSTNSSITSHRAARSVATGMTEVHVRRRSTLRRNPMR